MLFTPLQAADMLDAAAPAYRVLVTGSRGYDNRTCVERNLVIALNWAISKRKRLVVVHGDCPQGADMYADQWAVRMRNLGYPVDPERHPAQHHPTEDFGPWPAAGPRRNIYMASLGASECYAFVVLCEKPRCPRSNTPHLTHGADSCMKAAARAGIHVSSFYGRDVDEALRAITAKETRQ